MKIEAHKDLATGRVFETLGALEDFQAEQKKLAETAARIEAIRARLTEMRGVVRSKLETADGLCVLVRDVYQETLDLLQELVVLRGIKRTKAQQKRIDVVKVEAWDFSFRPDRHTHYVPNSGVIMSCTLRVTLTSDAYGKLFCEEMSDLSFGKVIGMRTGGGGASTDDSDGTYAMRYSVNAPLKELPLMYPRVVELVEMAEAESKHRQALQRAQLEAFNQDPEVLAISAELGAAERAVREAIAARDAVQARMDQRGEEITAAVVEATPFQQQARYDKAQEGFADVKEEWESVRFYL